MNETIEPMLKEKINLETSQIAWRELQRFFAQGLAVYVSSELDLIEVAFQFSLDNKVLVEAWMEDKKIGLVTDQQALAWLNADAEVWTVVVKPWLLVQG